MTDGTRVRKYSIYNALQLALSRAEVEKSGAVATLLIECFLEDAGRLQASKVIAREICEDRRFTEWRDAMVKAGWLIWSHTQADRGLYFAGKRLLPYINREKLKSQEIVTKKDIELKADRDEVQDLRAKLNEHEERLARIENITSRLQWATEPPDTNEKAIARKDCVGELAEITRSNLL